MPEMRVAEDTLRQTFCGNNYCCLFGKQEDMCKVDSTAGKTIFIKSPSTNDFCKYCFSYGDSFICNCPTRNEIHKKYGV